MNLFVYGTLRSHEPNHHYLQTAKRISEACWVFGRLFDTGYGYPGLLLGTDNRVYGELYELDGNCLAQIDELEGCAADGTGEYRRILITVYTNSGLNTAFVYVYNGDAVYKAWIEQGDWPSYKNTGK